MKKMPGVVLLLAASCAVPTVMADNAPNSDAGVAAGSTANASAAASGSTTAEIAMGVGTAAVIGAIIAGSSDNKGTATTSTTSTH